MQMLGAAMAKGKIVGVNERGLRVGEDHQRAVLTDHEVETMRHLHEVDGIGYRRLVKMFEVSKTTVRRICAYQMRNQAVSKFRKV
jgi:DNA invertase Pin-like site-specific DNA recombinase